MAEWKDRQNLFHRTHPATAGGPANTTAVDWHSKVKDIEHNVGLTKNYCMTVSMQKISSIHKLLLKIHWILGSRKLNGHAHFWPHPTKNQRNNFQFSWICTSMQKISSFHLFIFEMQSLLRVWWLDLPHPFLTTQNFFDQLFIYKNLYQHTKNQANLLICSRDMID